MIIKNRVEIVEQLAELLRKFDIELNKYDTYVYLYYNSESQTASLDTFVNASGREWLDDDHYTIYTDRQHPDKAVDSFNTIEEIAEAIGMTESKLLERTKKYLDLDDEEYKDWLNSSTLNIWLDVADFVNCYYSVEIQKAYEKLLDNLNTEYEATADEIISGFEELHKPKIKSLLNPKYIDSDKYSYLDEED